MAIEPPAPNYPRGISVVEPVSPALERVKRMLFKPFDLAKWITIGFCAWLASLGESGGGGNFNFGNHNSSHGGKPSEHVRHFYHEASDFVISNLYWIIPLTVLVVIFVVALWLLVLWLSSRGKFMFLHCVALDKAEVAEPWTKFKSAANSLFRFRIGLGLIGMVLTLPLLALIGIVILRMVLRDEVNLGGVMTAVLLALMFLLIVLVLLIIRKFTEDFVVPIQFLGGDTCLVAWGKFNRLLSANPAQFALYILFQIVMNMAITVIVVMAVLLTCCIAGCLMLLPFLGTVLLLPVLVFKRSYSLYYLAQYGYDIFPIPPPAPPVRSPIG